MELCVTNEIEKEREREEKRCNIYKNKKKKQ